MQRRFENYECLSDNKYRRVKGGFSSSTPSARTATSGAGFSSSISSPKNRRAGSGKIVDIFAKRVFRFVGDILVLVFDIIFAYSDTGIPFIIRNAGISSATTVLAMSSSDAGISSTLSVNFLDKYPHLVAVGKMQ